MNSIPNRPAIWATRLPRQRSGPLHTQPLSKQTSDRLNRPLDPGKVACPLFLPFSCPPTCLLPSPCRDKVSHRTRMFSEFNTPPGCTSVNASSCRLPDPTHHARPRRLARSYLVRLFHSRRSSGFLPTHPTPFSRPVVLRSDSYGFFRPFLPAGGRSSFDGFVCGRAACSDAGLEGRGVGAVSCSSPAMIFWLSSSLQSKS